MFSNEIGDGGAKELADALKSNKVGQILSLLIVKMVDSFMN